ncbi:MAG: rRNA maturation RNase YbeY [bacterium]
MKYYKKILLQVKMILIKNSQKKIQINENQITKNLNEILDKINYKNFDINIWFTTNNTIKKYNKNYRKKNKATDILSFPFYEKLKAGEQILASSKDEQILGDIIISLEFCKKYAAKNKLNFSDYLIRIIIHGIAHLLGFDHLTDEQFEKMKKFEKKLLNILNIKIDI